MTNIADIQAMVATRAQVKVGAATTDELTAAEQNVEIDRALRIYSMDEPQTIHEEKIVGDLTDVDGVKFFELDKWDEHTSDSEELTVEFPIDLPRKSLLRQGHDLAWVFSERPVAGVRKFFIQFFEPPTGAPPDDKWRVRYMARWPSIAENATLSTLDKRAVFMVGILASVYIARVLSSRFGKTEDPQLTADVVDYRSKSAEWRDIANELWKEYKEHISRPKEVKRAGQDVAVVDLDLSIGRPNRFGRNYLIHSRRRR